MPSTSAVTKKVRIDVSLYSGYPEDKIDNKMILSKPPLSYVDPAWNSLTLSLRAYIRFYSQDQTILLAEVKKKDQSVQGLIEIVLSRTPR